MKVILFLLCNLCALGITCQDYTPFLSKDSIRHGVSSSPSLLRTQSLEPTLNSTRSSIGLPLVSIKSNSLALAASVFNIGAEKRFFLNGKNMSIDLSIYYSPYTIARDYTMRMFVVHPELRYWLSKNPNDILKGHFVGFHLFTGSFNFAFDNKVRKQNNKLLIGTGFSYGYAHSFNDRWGIEGYLGLGYVNARYDLFYNISNGAKYGEKTKNYWGITRAGVALSYTFY